MPVNQECPVSLGNRGATIGSPLKTANPAPALPPIARTRRRFAAFNARLTQRHNFGDIRECEWIAMEAPMTHSMPNGDVPVAGQTAVRSAMVGSGAAVAAGTAKATGWLALGKVAAGAGAMSIAMSPLGAGLAVGVVASLLWGANAVRHRRTGDIYFGKG